ncbi:PGF-CTERM sorting domain-containing protein [Haloterrigena turkmenica]|nr:PGF-CTERM sorting domain-containing protein [Haloterrigena turkmenica]
MVALSTVAAGAATAAAADADDGADTDLEVTVDAPDLVATTEASTFDVTVTTADGEPAETDVVFEISGEDVQKEVTASTDDTGSVTFTAEGIALPEGDYEWTVTAGDEERSGTLTVTDTADDGATNETATNDTETVDNGAINETAANDTETVDNGATNETAANDTDTADNDTTASENDTATDETAVDNDTEAVDNDTTASENDTATADDDTEAADNDSETEEDESVPGFGIGGALSAVLAGTLLLVRRRS